MVDGWTKVLPTALEHERGRLHPVSTEEQTLGPEAQRVAFVRWAEARKIQRRIVAYSSA